MKKSFLTVLLFLISLTFLSSFAQENTNIVLVAPTNSEVAYKVNLSNIQIGKSFDVSYTMPSAIMRIIDVGTNITVLGDTDIVINNISDKNVYLSVITYAIQPYPMPSLLITALDFDSNTNLFYTPGFTIPISNDIVSNTNLTLQDIEPIYFVWDHLWTIIIVLILLIILGIVFIPRWISPKEKIVKEDPIDPFELIQEKLKKLKKQQNFLTEDSYKEFFVELSEALREFISYTLVPFALELPTRDLIQMMKELKLEEDLQEIITFLMRSTDRAKYAKQIFSADRIEEVMVESFRMVKIVRRQKEKEKADELRKS